MNSLGPIAGVPDTIMNKTNNTRRRHNGRALTTTHSTVPAGYANNSVTRAPRITRHADGITVEHEEYVSQFNSDSLNEFAYYADSISPTNGSLFRWLAQIAVNFESFDFLEFTPIIKAAGSTDRDGSWILAVDYDAADPDSSQTVQSLSQFAGTCNTNVYKDAKVVCPRERLRKLGPQRFCAADEGYDRTNSAGVVYWALTPISGVGANETTFTLAHRWVKYKVRLYTPQLPSGLDDQRALTPQLYAATSAAGRTTNVPGTAPFGYADDKATSMIELFEAGDFDLNHFIQMVSANSVGAGGVKLVDVNGTAAVDGLKTLFFSKDFQGIMRLAFPKLNFTAATTVDPTQIKWKEWFKVATDAAGNPLPTSTPNASSNLTNVLGATVLNAVSNGVVTFDSLMKIAAGTFLTLTTGQTAGSQPLCTTSGTGLCSIALNTMALSPQAYMSMKSVAEKATVRAHPHTLNGRQQFVLDLPIVSKPMRRIF